MMAGETLTMLRVAIDAATEQCHTALDSLAVGDPKLRWVSKVLSDGYL